MSAPPDPSARSTRAQDEPELKAIMTDLWENSERLVQQELQLALSELDVRVDRAKLALRHGAIAGGLFHAAYLTALATLVLLLSELVAPWLAALLVALLAGAGAYWFLQRSKQAAQQASRPDTQTYSPQSIVPPIRKDIRKERAHVSATE
jgi:hypothetical protein